MSTHAHYSAPDREDAPRPLASSSRDWITGKLADLRQRIATVPDATRIPLMACPVCRAAIALRESRHGARFIATHPPAVCAESNELWHLHEPTIEGAVAKLEGLLTV